MPRRKNNFRIIDGTKECSRCHQLKPVSMFAKDRQQSCGLKCWCKPCRLEQMAEYRRTDRGKLHHRTVNIDRRNSSPENFIRSLYHSAKQRSRRSVLPFTISLEQVFRLYYAQNGRCYYSNRPMTVIAGAGKLDTNVSMERLNTAEGYTSENVVLCCYFINVSKRDRSIHEWLGWAEDVREFQSEHQKVKVSYPKAV
jgi:hypothetical protein